MLVAKFPSSEPGTILTPFALGVGYAQTAVLSSKRRVRNPRNLFRLPFKGATNKMPLTALLFLQTGLSANQPTYFFPVFIGLLAAGGVGWLVAAVLGFARARAFGASTRWFSFAAVCLIIYHIQFIVLGFLVILGAPRNDFDPVLNVGAFLNLFIVLGAFCAIMGFVRLTNPPR